MCQNHRSKTQNKECYNVKELKLINAISVRDVQMLQACNGQIIQNEEQIFTTYFDA